MNSSKKELNNDTNQNSSEGIDIGRIDNKKEKLKGDVFLYICNKNLIIHDNLENQEILKFHCPIKIKFLASSCIA